MVEFLVHGVIFVVLLALVVLLAPAILHFVFAVGSTIVGLALGLLITVVVGVGAVLLAGFIAALVLGSLVLAGLFVAGLVPFVLVVCLIAAAVHCFRKCRP